ncbi:MAG: DNA adenine methylase [Actinomycetaceae bacterium]|nr:DNA adenine methylase [Actinomycetaceae bacterium]
MIKYLGSKRVLLPVLGTLAQGAQVQTAWDLFCGTTRVSQEFKRRGIRVTANDLATYSYHLARCYIETDIASVDLDELSDTIARLNALPGKEGYVTQVFCRESRYFQPKNGMRIDAIRDCIEQDYKQSWMYSLLLTSLMLAADRVDSTVGVQMAYLKKWAARSFNDLELRIPQIPEGPSGYALCEDANELTKHCADAKAAGVLQKKKSIDDASSSPQASTDAQGRSLALFEKDNAVSGDTMRCSASVLHDNPPDLVYMDPPYNQHKYFSNYHIWETLVRWDNPEAYGVARKRIDARDTHNASPFNSKPRIYAALSQLFTSCQTMGARMAMVSYNDESWVTRNAMELALEKAGWEHVQTLGFESKRYVGSQIGVHNQKGHRVGTPGHDRNIEYIFLAGEKALIAEAIHALESSEQVLYKAY